MPGKAATVVTTERQQAILLELSKSRTESQVVQRAGCQPLATRWQGSVAMIAIFGGATQATIPGLAIRFWRFVVAGSRSIPERQSAFDDIAADLQYDASAFLSHSSGQSARFRLSPVPGPTFKAAALSALNLDR